jgi:hypothetical protein
MDMTSLDNLFLKLPRLDRLFCWHCGVERCDEAQGWVRLAPEQCEWVNLSRVMPTMPRASFAPTSQHLSLYSLPSCIVRADNSVASQPIRALACCSLPTDCTLANASGAKLSQ